MAIVSGVLSDLFDIPLSAGSSSANENYWQGVAQRLQAEAQQTTPEPDTTEPGA